MQRLGQRSLKRLCVGLMLTSVSLQAKSREQRSPRECAEYVRRAHRAAREWTSSPWGDHSSVRLMTYNMLNLRMDEEKTHKTRAQANAILEIMPDIAVLQEVEGRKKFTAQENLSHYASNILNGEFVSLMGPPTKEQRPLEIGFLVRRELLEDFEFEVIPNNDRSAFVRGVPLLLGRRKGMSMPSIAVFGIHLKSLNSRPISDQTLAYARKRASQINSREIQETVNLVLEFEARYPQTPYVISGDLNRDIARSIAIQKLRRRLQVKDSMSLMRKGVNSLDRATAFYFENGVRRFARQNDGHFMSRHLQGHVLNSWTYRYRDEHGHEIPMPETFAERETLPSDHYPVVVDISTRAWD